MSIEPTKENPLLYSDTIDGQATTFFNGEIETNDESVKLSIEEEKEDNNNNNNSNSVNNEEENINLQLQSPITKHESLQPLRQAEEKENKPSSTDCNNNDNENTDKNEIGKHSSRINNSLNKANYTELHHLSTKYSEDDLKEFIPSHLKNSFIENGYRINLSFKQATLTLFTIHNETMNIWTALIPFLVFLSMGVYVCVWDLLQWMDRMILLVYILGALISFGGSTVFHWYGCGMCEKINSMTMRLDYAGIAALVGGSFIPPIYYSFYCSTFSKMFYLITIGALSVISFCLFVLPPAKYMDRLRLLRITVFVLIAGFGGVPIIHILIREGFSQPDINLEIGLIFVTWSIYGIGVFFYASKVPERLWPGKFDIWFHSHQLWHIWVFLGTLAHCLNCILLAHSFYSYGRNKC